MTAAAPESPEIPDPLRRKRPRPLDSLTAASTRLTDRNLERFSKVHKGTTDNWQTECRELYHLVGEYRFLANMIANRVGQARLHVAKLSEDPTADPDPINTETEDLPEGTEPPSEDDLKAVAAFQSVGETPIQRAQMVTRAAINLYTTGDGWFVGTPPSVEAELNPTPEVTGTLVQAPVSRTVDEPTTELDLTTLTWRFLSTAEVSFDKTSHDVKLQIGDSEKGTWEGNPDRLLMFRNWRPDPFEWWTADSPTRASLPVLRELVGLTMAVSAQVDSRLAGAGVFLVPQSAKDAVLAAMGPPQEGQEDEDPFVDAIMEAMLTPISDRSNASALVPLILTVPDDTIEKFRHLKFSSDLDAQYQTLRAEALNRFALGADAPPEALTGVGGMNHWGAWIVKEDTVTTHVEPPTAIICDAWTTQFLWPVLEAAGMAPEVARQYVVWYSVEHLIVRPNRFQDAILGFDREELSGEALRKYGGFTDDDAPEGGPDQAFAMVLQLIKKAPALAVTPGIPALVEQIRAVLNSSDPLPGSEAQAVAADSPDGVPPDPAAAEGPPATDQAPANPDGMAASGATADWTMPGITDANLAEALEGAAREMAEEPAGA
jgi:hypothetical protein